MCDCVLSKLHDMLNAGPTQGTDVGLLLHQVSTLAAHGDVAAWGAAGLLRLCKAHDTFTVALHVPVRQRLLLRREPGQNAVQAKMVCEPYGRHRRLPGIEEHARGGARRPLQ